jgi:hypothetical protein
VIRVQRVPVRASIAVGLLVAMLTACSGGTASPGATGGTASGRSQVPSRTIAPPNAGQTLGPAITFDAPGLESFPVPAAGTQTTPPLQGARPPTVLTPQVIRDPAADNVDAITFLLPEGWQAQGDVLWLPEWERLTYVRTTIFDPSTGVTIDWLPIQDFIWFDPPAGFSAPIGGNYQGKGYVPPITDPGQFVADFWMPAMLPHLRSATLTRVNQVPAVAAEFVRGFGGPADAFAYVLRYQYDQGGTTWDEDVSFALLYSSANGITSWYVNFAYTVRAPAGQLDRNAGVISTVVASRNVTPQWEAVYRLVQQLFIQGIRQQMADTEAFGRTLAQYRAETAALQAQVTQERQASQDRIADLRGQALQGIETYVNPVSREMVQLPVGWSDYWVNPQGQYVASDPGFDPGTFGGGGWQRLERRP